MKKLLIIFILFISFSKNYSQSPTDIYSNICTSVFNSYIKKYLESTGIDSFNNENLNTSLDIKPQVKPRSYRPINPQNPLEAQNAKHRVNAYAKWVHGDNNQCIKELNYIKIQKRSTLNNRDLEINNDIDLELYASCYLKTKDYAKAYQKLRQIRYPNTEHLYTLGVLATLINKYEESIKYFSQYLNTKGSKNHSDPEIYELLGNIYYIKSEPEIDLAFQNWLKAITTGSKKADYLTYFMAVAQFYGKNYNKARELFNEVIKNKYDKWLLPSQYYLGRIELDNNDFLKAKEKFIQPEFNTAFPNPIEFDILKKVLLCDYHLALAALENKNITKAKNYLKEGVDYIYKCGISLDEPKHRTAIIVYSIMQRLHEELNKMPHDNSRSTFKRILNTMSPTNERKKEKVIIKEFGNILFLCSENEYASIAYNIIRDLDLIAENNYYCINDNYRSFSTSDEIKNFDCTKYLFMTYLLFNYCQFNYEIKNYSTFFELSDKFKKCARNNIKESHIRELLVLHYETLIKCYNEDKSIPQNIALQRQMQIRTQIGSLCERSTPPDTLPEYIVISTSNNKKNELVILLAQEFLKK